MSLQKTTFAIDVLSTKVIRIKIDCESLAYSITVEGI
jgi:hypothetical protein